MIEKRWDFEMISYLKNNKSQNPKTERNRPWVGRHLPRWRRSTDPWGRAGATACWASYDEKSSFTSDPLMTIIIGFAFKSRMPFIFRQAIASSTYPKYPGQSVDNRAAPEYNHAASIKLFSFSPFKGMFFPQPSTWWPTWCPTLRWTWWPIWR